MRYDVCTATDVHEKNLAARQATADFILFCGAGQMMEGAEEALAQAVAKAADSVAVFELRRFPHEHPKYYDPATGEAVWVCGDSCLVRRAAFLAVDGLDETVFSDIADVDFSWRLRAGGWSLRYVADAMWAGATDGQEGAENGENAAAPQDAQLMLADAATANRLLRLRFGTEEDLIHWDKLLCEMTGNVSTTPAMEARFVQRMAAVKRLAGAARAFYHAQVEHSGFAPQFSDFDAAFMRAGASYVTVLPKKTPEFTVVIRAYQRPQHLARTLDSLHRQTYRHFHVLVMEDGEAPVCGTLCEKAAQTLPLTYHAMHANAGRCETGNAGVRMAKTKYVCFLDDDDYFFAEHLETMAAALEKNPDCSLFFAGSVEAACARGAALQVEHFWSNCRAQLTREDFFAGNPVSIQAAVLTRELFLQCGGIDSELDALEDWDLWLRCILRVPFVYIGKATSLYRVPADKTDYAAREVSFARYRAAMQPRLMKYCAQAGIPVRNTENAVLKAPQTGKEACQGQDTAAARHLAALRIAARSVCAAKGWALAAPLRALTGNKKIKLFGPPAPDFATADAAALNRFIFAARTCVFWRALSRLAAHGHTQ